MNKRIGKSRIQALWGCTHPNACDPQCAGSRAWLLRNCFKRGRCSLCREDIVRGLSRRRLLASEMLEECLFDANEALRLFAERRCAKKF